MNKNNNKIDLNSLPEKRLQWQQKLKKELKEKVFTSSWKWVLCKMIIISFNWLLMILLMELLNKRNSTIVGYFSVLCGFFLFSYSILEYLLKRSLLKNTVSYLERNNLLDEYSEKDKDLKRKEISELNIELMIARKVLEDALYLKNKNKDSKEDLPESKKNNKL